MFARSARVLVALAVVELAVFLLAATQVNVLLLVLVVAAISAYGVAFLSRQTASMVRRSVEDLTSAAPGGRDDIGDRGLLVVAGLLLAFPGLLTGLLGSLLLLRPVRSAARGVIGARLGRLIPAELSASVADMNRVFRRRDVLDVDGVIKDPNGSSRKPSAPPELH